MLKLKVKRPKPIKKVVGEIEGAVKSLKKPLAKKPSDDEAENAKGKRLEDERSVFEETMEQLQQLKANSMDGENHAVLTALATMTTDLIPLAERSYRFWKSERAIIPLDKLILQFRELTAELRKLSENKNQAKVINDKLGEFISILVTQHLESSHKFSMTLERIKDKEIKRKLEIAHKEQSNDVKEAIKEVHKGLSAFINDFFEPVKKKH